MTELNDRRKEAVGAAMNPPLQMVRLSDSRRCNAGCSYCPSRNFSIGRRLSLSELERVVDFFVAYTNGVRRKPRSLFFVFNTLGEMSLGTGNLVGLADYIERVNGGGRCAVSVYLFLASTNLLDAPDGLVEFVNRYGYVTVSLHGRPAAEYATRIARFDERVTLEGTDVIPRHRMDLFERYSEILRHFDLAAMRPVRESPMTAADSALWVEEIAELTRRLDALSDEALAGFLTRLSFGDTLLNTLMLLDRGARLHYRCHAGVSSLQVTPEMEFYPCMFLQHPDLRMGDIKRGLDLAWHGRFEALRRAGARPECAACGILDVCGGPCLDWARKDPSGDGLHSPVECLYRRGLFRTAAAFLERIERRPRVIEAVRRHCGLGTRDRQPKAKGEGRCSEC
jgi:radical SAM protein with 4Fe4S-binding SPASM domain